MKGATDVQLRITMDASQARAEAISLQREMNRRFRAPTAEDARRVAYERSIGLPVNPVNPNLPYEPMRHSGIWWANQRGIKGLGSEQYRHQFFNEREAKYMGLQFAKAAKKELIQGAKGFASAMGMYALDQGMATYFAWAKVPGENNRQVNRNEATYGGVRSGAMTGGSMLGTLAMFTPWGLKAKLAMAGIGALTGGAIGGVSGNMQARANERNEDRVAKLADKEQRDMRRYNWRLMQSDMALRRQMELMPSRRQQISALKHQINRIRVGEGSLSIKSLEGQYNAMVEGGVWNGRRYKKGDLNTTHGKYVQTMLSRQRDRLDTYRAQLMQVEMTPYAKPQDAITDSYSRRGLYVGAQVDTISFNREIINNMKKIVDALEKIHAKTGENTRMFDFEGGGAGQKIRYK